MVERWRSHCVAQASLKLLASNRVLLCLPDWSAMVQSWLTATSASWGQAIPLPQPPKYLGLQVCATTQIIFVILVEIAFHLIGQADLELLTSGDPLTLASQSAGITSVSHCIQHILGF
ncbi:hypothetical protein AAY473_035742 [Plecturocebus cupreus]